MTRLVVLPNHNNESSTGIYSAVTQRACTRSLLVSLAVLNPPTRATPVVAVHNPPMPMEPPPPRLPDSAMRRRDAAHNKKCS